ncbi:putative reverse transcriptase domain, DNA/RNA polymerase superfamily [Helianthus annuus]|nr:putative reverse transcriptase domain, DNA/RNA polymerase superfamily [Helianthus annuus]
MYARSVTSVRAPVGDTDFFRVEVGLHQGSALSPFLFAVVLDELSKSIQERVPWCLLFADDIVLVVENKQSRNARLEDWRVALEGKGLRISRSKTGYLHCDFSGAGDVEDTQITLEGQGVQQTTKFKYLGSFIQRDGELDSDVAHRVQAGWCRWRAATGVLCDKRFPAKLKGKFYRVTVRPSMLYRTKCWATKKAQARKMEVAEMRMLRWMCGHTSWDRIRSDVFKSRLGVASIVDKMREGRLRWFGHVRRRQLTATVRTVEALTVGGRRSSGRPKLTWEERIRADLLDLHLSEDMVDDRNSWRHRIKAKDF